MSAQSVDTSMIQRKEIQLPASLQELPLKTCPMTGSVRNVE